MSKRFFRIFSIASVVAMLVAAVGVIPAFAAGAGWNDSFAAATSTALPAYAADALDVAIDLSGANVNTALDLGGCLGGPSFGPYQLHMLHSTPVTTTLTYARARVVSTDLVQGNWAVRISLNDAVNTQVACAENDPTGVVDIVGTIPIGSGFYVTLANVSGKIPIAATTFENWVFTTTNPGGGLLVNMAGDAGAGALRDVEASPVGGTVPTWATDTYAPGTFGVAAASYSAVLDVPAGTYDLGFEDQTAGQELAVFQPAVAVPSLTGPGYLAINPTALAIRTVNVNTEDEAGANVNLNIVANTNASLIEDLDVGASAAGTADFIVNPGVWGWDVAAWDDNVASPNYFLVKRNVNPLLGAVDFRLNTVAHADVLLCYPVGAANPYADADLIDIDPQGSLQARTFDFFADGAVGCGVGFDGTLLLLSENIPGAADNENIAYGGFSVNLDGSDAWDYTFTPTIPVWAFAGTAGVHVADYAPIFGQTPFVTTIGVIAATTNVDAPGTMTLTREAWTDQFGNVIIGISDGTAVPVTPIDLLHYGVLDATTTLAADFLTTPFGPISKIGRYLYERLLPHGLLPNALPSLIGIPAGAFSTVAQFAINPADTHFVVNWAYHYIMSMYEMGMTGGISATQYGPALPVSRGQMSTYLMQGLVRYGGATLPAYTGAFCDVDAGAYYAASTQLLKDLGVSAGIGVGACPGGGVGDRYAPSQVVKRGDMAIFLEKSGYAAVPFSGTMGWPVALGTPLFYPLGFGGAWYPNTPGVIDGFFSDIPASSGAYYGSWAEELIADRITAGCFPGTPYVNLQYCPAMTVDRSMMAVFLFQTWRGAAGAPVAPWGPGPLWWVGPLPEPSK